jgi:hypothetical protein
VFRRRRRIQKRRLVLGRLAEEHAQVDPVDELHDEEAGAVGFTESKTCTTSGCAGRSSMARAVMRAGRWFRALDATRPESQP